MKNQMAMRAAYLLCGLCVSFCYVSGPMPFAAKDAFGSAPGTENGSVSVAIAGTEGVSSAAGCANVRLQNESKCTDLGESNCDACPLSCITGCTTIWDFRIIGGSTTDHGEILNIQCLTKGSTYDVLNCTGTGPTYCDCDGAPVSINNACTWWDEMFVSCDTGD